MKLLIYGNGKQDDLIWDASTPEKEAARQLLTARRLYEYETWHFGKLTDPLAVTQ